MTQELSKAFHLHLVSDATGETLKTIARAASVQYRGLNPHEHLHSLIRNEKQLANVTAQIKQKPGIVLHTLINQDLTRKLIKTCDQLGVPHVAVLDPVLNVIGSYLDIEIDPVVGGQHHLDENYFRRMDALNFALLHDDGLLPNDLNEADIILVGISRTSKTPTSIYLANRGYKVANVPLVPNIPLPEALMNKTNTFIVGLISSPERISQIRRNRVKDLADRDMDDYVDRSTIQQELKYARQICNKMKWDLIDVSRRSIEETSAAILKLYEKHLAK